MKPGQWSRVFVVAASMPALVPVTCNSIFAKRNPAADDGYEYVTVLGSSIQKRIKKGADPLAGSPVDTMGAEGFRKMTQQLTGPASKAN